MDTQTLKSYRRRNYFIEKSFQARFILKFALLVALAGILTIVILYFLSLQSTTVAIVNSRVVVRTTADFILPLLVQTVAVVTVIAGLATIAVTLLMSHKIAGPLYRFKKVLKSLEEGDFSSEFRLRHLDQLQDVAKAFNEMIAKIRSELSVVKKEYLRLKEKLSSIAEEDISQGKRTALLELKKLIDELEKVIHYFKT